MRFLVTRPQPDAASTLDRLAALDLEAVSAPVMTRQSIPVRLPPAEGFDAVAISSTNALRALAEQDGLSPFLDKKLFAVGDRTAHEARELGFAGVTAADGTLASLATAIALAQLDGPVFYPAGRHLSGDLAGALAPHGLMVITVTVYEMVASAALPERVLADLAEGVFGAVLLYSRRSAELFAKLAGPALSPEKRRQLPVLCLSENVAAPLLADHFSRVLLADHPSEDAMMALALAFAREQTAP